MFAQNGPWRGVTARKPEDTSRWPKLRKSLKCRVQMVTDLTVVTRIGLTSQEVFIRVRSEVHTCSGVNHSSTSRIQKLGNGGESCRN